MITDKALEKTLNLLEWTGFKKKDGEWAFLKDRQGNVVEWLVGPGVCPTGEEGEGGQSREVPLQGLR